MRLKSQRWETRVAERKVQIIQRHRAGAAVESFLWAEHQWSLVEL